LPLSSGFQAIGVYAKKVVGRAVYLETVLTPQIDYLGTLRIVYETCSSESLIETTLVLPSGLSKPPSTALEANSAVSLFYDFVFVVICP